MTAANKTLIYLAVAVVSVGLGFVVHSATSESAATEAEDVGGFLYPDPEDPTRSAFDDPSVARGLEIAVFDDDTAELETFEVKYDEGVWRLENFNGYPTDAGTKLGETLTSVAFIEKEGLQTRSPAQHGELGVLDPLDDSTTAEQGHGDRITIHGEGETVLADVIVGKRVPDSDIDNLRYVRKADEDTVYRARVELNVRTGFGDWINDDLLALDPKNDIDLPDEEENDDETPAEKEAREERERRRRELMKKAELIGLSASPPIFSDVVGPDALDLYEVSRETSTEDWTLADIDDATEELESNKVDNIVRALERLKIIGVRRKPEQLTADLGFESTGDPIRDRLAIENIRNDLRTRGFVIVQDEDDGLDFAGMQGQLVAATTSGITYHLHFGDVFKGSEKQLQIGGNAEEVEPGESEKSGRFLVVRVAFDEKYVADRPEEPVPPTKPEGLDEPEPDPGDPEPMDPDSDDADPGDEEDADADDGDEATDGDEDASDEAGGDDSTEADDEPNSESETADPSNGDDPSGDDPGTAEPEDPKPTREELQAEYDIALKAHEAAVKRYEKDLEAWKERVEYGRERTKVLQNRFGEWYYVISDTDFEDLSLPRSALVKPKEPPPEPPKRDDPDLPDPADPNGTDPQPMPGDPSPSDPSPTDPKPGEDAPGEDGKDEPTSEKGPTDEDNDDEPSPEAPTPDGPDPADDGSE